MKTVIQVKKFILANLALAFLLTGCLDVALFLYPNKDGTIDVKTVMIPEPEVAVMLREDLTKDFQEVVMKDGRLAYQSIEENLQLPWNKDGAIVSSIKKGLSLKLPEDENPDEDMSIFQKHWIVVGVNCERIKKRPKGNTVRIGDYVVEPKYIGKNRVLWQIPMVLSKKLSNIEFVAKW